MNVHVTVLLIVLLCPMMTCIVKIMLKSEVLKYFHCAYMSTFLVTEAYVAYISYGQPQSRMNLNTSFQT